MGKVRVLIVEDDIPVSQLLSNRLERLGYEVSGIAANGPDAIGSAGKLRPDIVLMDIVIKGPMDGIETAVVLQREYGLPVIYLTSFADDATIERVEKSGAQGYVLKPVQEREVHAMIKLALGRHRRADEVSRTLRTAEKFTEQLRHSIGQAAFRLGGRGELSLGGEIEAALEEEQFELHYQPRVALSSGEIVGVEALLRWNHPQRGLLLPNRFLAAAEDVGCMQALDEWVLRKAATSAKAWRVERPSLRVTVNVSPVSLRRDALLTRITGILRDLAFDPAGLELDITESILLENSELDMAVLKEVKATGVSLALDNFGLANAAISNLQNFSFDTIKIDRSFVRRAASGRNASAVIQAIIYLAEAMGLETVAEGVETREELLLLAEHGCDDIQGYLFSAPVLLSEMRALLAEDKRLDVPKSTPANERALAPQVRRAQAAETSALDPISAEHQELIEQLVEERTRALQEANAELEAFAYLVTHDLRAPLRAIIGFTTILGDTAREKLDAEEARILDSVRRAGNRMAELIDALLALSRLARAEKRDATIDLSALAGEVLAELGHQYPGLAVESRIDPGLQTQGDPRMIRSLLENLIGNALKFSSQRPVAQIRFSRVDTHSGSAFCIADNGVGFAMDHADRLFGVFQRLHSDREFPGTGVGLASVRRIVLRHGGQVWAEAQPGQGAQFYFTLPPPAAA